MASAELDDNLTQTGCFDINGLLVWGGLTYINWSQLDTEAI